MPGVYQGVFTAVLINYRPVGRVVTLRGERCGVVCSVFRLPFSFSVPFWSDSLPVGVRKKVAHAGVEHGPDVVNAVNIATLVLYSKME